MGRNPETIRILSADDHPLLREGVGALTIEGEAAAGISDANTNHRLCCHWRSLPCLTSSIDPGFAPRGGFKKDSLSGNARFTTVILITVSN
jgi:hypothetical protein